MEEYSIVLTIFIGLWLLWFAASVYLIFVVVSKKLRLPKEYFIPFGHVVAGHEWLVLLFGLVSSVIALIAVAATVLAWIEYVFHGNVI